MKVIAGSFRLFRLLGITVYLHWSWFLIFLVELQDRNGVYNSILWNIAETLCLFLIVLMHEFGHALACRSVGGKAEQIMLWPLGGVAFVAPPQRPGAVLWSIFAGPLVNILLVPVTLAIFYYAPTVGLHGDPYKFIQAIFIINLSLLIFNMLPIYPLDGGQIVQSILWFFIGQAKSLMVAGVIGLIGAAGFVLLALAFHNYFLILIAAFGAWRSWVGFQQARALSRMESMPPIQFYNGVRCPACGYPPPVGPFWRCACGQPYDTFATNGICPRCGTQPAVTGCPHCYNTSPRAAWYPYVTITSGLQNS